MNTETYKEYLFSHIEYYQDEAQEYRKKGDLSQGAISSSMAVAFRMALDKFNELDFQIILQP